MKRKEISTGVRTNKSNGWWMMQVCWCRGFHINIHYALMYTAVNWWAIFTITHTVKGSVCLGEIRSRERRKSVTVQSRQWGNRDRERVCCNKKEVLLFWTPPTSCSRSSSGLCIAPASRPSARYHGNRRLACWGKWEGEKNVMQFVSFLRDFTTSSLCFPFTLLWFKFCIILTNGK